MLQLIAERERGRPVGPVVAEGFAFLSPVLTDALAYWKTIRGDAAFPRREPANASRPGRTQHCVIALLRRSLRGIERIFGLSRRTVSRWLAQWISQMPLVASTLLPAMAEDVLELDELWSFVGRKTKERWLWLALCRRTRQVVAYWLGDR